MKIKSFLILFCLSLFLNTFAQQYIIRVKTVGSGYYFVDENEKRLSNNEYKIALDFTKEGVTIVSNKRESGFKIINTEEEIIETNFPLNPIYYEWIGRHIGYRDGMLRTLHNYKMGAFNTKGILVVPAIYDDLTEFDSHHAIGLLNKKHFVVKNNGEQIELSFKKLKSYKRFSEGLAPIKIGKNWGFVDTLGQMAIHPRFKSVGYFFGGLAWAKTFGDKVGYIDKIGNWIILPKYVIAHNFGIESGMARVKKGYTWGYVNRNSEFLTLNNTGSFYDFSEGLAIKKTDGRFGYINILGEWVLQLKFVKAYPFTNGFAKVLINTKLGLINTSGQFILSPKYMVIGHAVKIKNQHN